MERNGSTLAILATRFGRFDSGPEFRGSSKSTLCRSIDLRNPRSCAVGDAPAPGVGMARQTSRVVSSEGDSADLSPHGCRPRCGACPSHTDQSTMVLV